jgi:carotenoid cleavage dioxygenase-like enzyme
MHYGVVDAAGKRTVYQAIDLPGPRLPHDMAFSANYSILNDLPVFWDAGLLERGIHAVRLHKGVPSRFGIVPRHGGEPRWFEAAPTYVLHWLNAYEDGDEIVLDGYFQENPIPRPLEDAPEGHGHLMAYLDEHSFRPKLHRWRFNLATGETTEQHLDERILEFGMFNQAYAGRPYRYAYSTTAKPGWFLFNGFVKHDLETGESLDPAAGGAAMPARRRSRRGRRCRRRRRLLVSFIIDENRGRPSACDGRRARPCRPTCRIALPHKISSGTHSVWAGREMLRG